MKIAWYWFVVAGLLLVAGGALALHVHDQDVIRAAMLGDSLKVTQHRVDSLTAEGNAIEIKVVHDTVVLAKWRTRYDTIEKRVVLNVHDTVAVVQFVHTADSTIAACTQLVSDCQARTKILTEQVAAVSAERDLWRKQAPDIWQRHETLVCSSSGVIGLVAGLIVGKRL